MRIDAHQHFWQLSRGDYDWMSPALGPIYRDFAVGDLAPLMTAVGLHGTVLVQAAATNAETGFLLATADASDLVKGVVGWIDFEDPRQLTVLEDFARHPKFRGVRPMIQEIPDVDWMLRPALDWAYQAIIDRDLVFDALGHPRHLANFLTLFKRYPKMRAVVDHAMKPEIEKGRFAEWADGIGRIAAETQAVCKLSGLITEAGSGWTAALLKPYVKHVLESFGADRVMWGSDWPVLNLAGDYLGWFGCAQDLVREVTGSQTAVDAVFGGTAARVYRLG